MHGQITMYQLAFLAVNTWGIIVIIAVFASLFVKIFQTNAFLHSARSKAKHTALATQGGISPKAPTFNPTPERPSGIELIADELKEFLRTVNYDLTRPPHPRNLELEHATNRVFEAEVASGKLTREALITIREGMPIYCAGAEMYYTDHPFEVRVLIATYITIAVVIDDLCQMDSVEMVPKLQRFVETWGDDGSHPHHPTLDHFRRVVTIDVPKYYGPVSTGNIVHASIGFLVGCIMENEFPKGVACPPTSSRFPRFLRMKSGCSEVFAYFIFAEVMFPEKEFLETYIPTIPDILDFTDIVNDILSFYKESVIGTEQNTYLMNMSKVLGCSPVDVLRDECKRMSRLVKDISATLSRNEELQKAWEVYRVGYIMWHISQKRYKLSVVGIDSPAD